MVYVCYTADSGYAMQVAVSMISMLENNKNNEIEFYIMGDSYSDEVKYRFTKIEKNYNTKINIIDISEKMKILKSTALATEDGIIQNGNISYMFARLFVGSSIPKCISKIIYIDCDTIYVGNIKELYDIEVESENIFAAVRDMWPATYNAAIGLKNTDLYFQSGILLINLDKWRELECEKQILNIAGMAQHYFFMHDQDILNICFHGKIQTLSPKYGMIYLLRRYSAEECIWFSGKNEIQYYTINAINEAKDNIHVIHYAGDYFGRPWSFPFACKDNREWLKYYKLSPWSEEDVGRHHDTKAWIKFMIKLMAYPFVKKIWLRRTKKRFEISNKKMIEIMQKNY